jgi:hypothetical protein
MRDKHLKIVSSLGDKAAQTLAYMETVIHALQPHDPGYWMYFCN